MAEAQWTSSSESDVDADDSWPPANVQRNKHKQRRAIISDDDSEGSDTDNDSDREIVGCTSDEKEGDDSLTKSDTDKVIGDSSFEEGEVTSKNQPSSSDSGITNLIEASPATSTGKNGSGVIPPRRRRSSHRPVDSNRKSPAGDAAEDDEGDDSFASAEEDLTQEINEEEVLGETSPPVADGGSEEGRRRVSASRALVVDDDKEKSDEVVRKNKRQVTSTPVKSGFNKPSLLDITAIPGGLPRFNATLMGSDESPEVSPRKEAPTTTSKPEKMRKALPPVTEDVEDMLVAGLNDITLKGKQHFSFKKKNDGAGSSKASAGATCLDYYDEEEEEEEASISANFDFDHRSDSGNGDSDIQVIQQGPSKPPPPKPVVTLDDSDDDLTMVTERLKKLPLGPKAPKQDAPRKAIFLNEPPPIEKKTYAYNPSDQKHQEFYGDVQRTVTKMAKTIEEMPMPDDDEELTLPKGLVNLFDHQRYGLRWLSWREREFPGGGILADEMGLGKTIMVIALIMKSKQDAAQANNENWIDTEEVGSCIAAKTTLVVCPVGCLLQWNDEISNKGKGLRVHMYHGPHRTTSAAQLAQYDIVLTTYHTIIAEVPKDPNERSRSPLKRLYWRRIVLDEAHNIRNPKTSGALAICQLKARHRWAVTGTPVHNRPEDFYSVVKFLKLTPFDDPKVWDFWIGMKQVRRATDAQMRLHTLGKALILRRTKLEVQSMGGNVQKIPPKVVEMVEIELNEEERRVYDYLMQYCKSMFKKFLDDKKQRENELNAAAMVFTAERKKKKQPQGEDGELPQDIRFSHLFALLIRMRQCAVLPHLIHTMLEDEDVDDDISFDELNEEHIVSKRNPTFERTYESTKFKRILEDLDALKQAAKAENRPMDKVVIVSSWTTTLDILHEHLRRRRFSSVFITGKEKPQDRSDNMKKFNNYPEKYHICLLSLMAGGVGLNLVGGNHVFFVEPHWNPQLELQAQDRVHRFGQKKDVSIKRYISKETVESRIMDIQEQKINLADGVLNSAKRTRGGGLSIDQLKKLFE